MTPSPLPLQPRSAYRQFVLSISFIIVSIIYVLWHPSSDSSITSVSALQTTPDQTLSPSQSYKAANDALLKTLTEIAATTAVPQQPRATTPVAQSTMPQSQPKMMPLMRPAGKYTDGSYTGSAADAYYGTVQVKAVVKNGLLTDVQFLQYPNDRSNSVYINNQAMPLLTQEALHVQSAQVDGVSGATFTSQAFEQSLATALVLAKR